jgi:site-specific recombinase XerD
MGLRSCEYVNVTFGEVENDDQVTIKDSKGDGSREVSVMKETRAAILEFKAFLKARNMFPKNDGVFEKPEGGYYSTSSFRRWMKQTAAACGIRAKLAQTHGLRHRYAMNYYSHTKDLVVLARLMGHKSMKTTRQYAEPTFESVQQSMQESVDKAYGILPQAA